MLPAPKVPKRDHRTSIGEWLDADLLASGPKGAKKLKASGLKPRAARFLEVIANDPFATSPRFEKLVGDLAGCYSRRINIRHRLVCEVLPNAHVVHVLRMWTHDE